jgi:hypothetical protein
MFFPCGSFSSTSTSLVTKRDSGRKRRTPLIAGIRKRRRFRAEIGFINEEIGRSRRFGFNFGVLVVEVDDSIPRGLSRLMPGKTISFHVLKRNLRNHDKVIGPFVRRYFILLPQTGENGVRAVEERLHQLAEEHRWGRIRVGAAAYPEDGSTSVALLEKAAGDPC